MFFFRTGYPVKKCRRTHVAGQADTFRSTLALRLDSRRSSPVALGGGTYVPFFVLVIFVLRDFIIIMGAAFHMTVYETAAPNPNIFGKITTFVHIGYLAGVFIDIIFTLNLTNFVVDVSVALVTLISLFLYGLNWFKLTAKLHRE